MTHGVIYSKAFAQGLYHIQANAQFCYTHALIPMKHVTLSFN
jgi:hypothetical protein